MKETKSSPQLINPFLIEESGMTFSELIEKVRSSELDHSRRRDLLSAINRYVTMTERIPSKAFVRVPEIRQKLLEIEPAKSQISEDVEQCEI
jgi:hypothetical protein